MGANGSTTDEETQRSSALDRLFEGDADPVPPHPGDAPTTGQTAEEAQDV